MTTIEVRRGTASEWAVANPMLADGEPGFETDTGSFKFGDGKRRWEALPYFLNQASVEASFARTINVLGYGAVGDGVSDDHAAIQRALDDANAVGGTVFLPPGYTFGLSNGLLIGNGVTLAGGGQGATVLKALDSFPVASVVGNLDQTTGNHDFTIRDLTVDGNSPVFQGRTDRYGLKWHHSYRWSVVNVTVCNVAGQGVFVTGGDERPRIGSFVNVVAHDNVGDGIWVGAGMRMVGYTSVMAKDNGRHGIVFDHSECMANGVYAHGNGERGIWIRNVFACQYDNLNAAQNGQDGIYVLGMTYSNGAAWRSQANGVSGSGYADIRFSDEVTSPGYGVSAGSMVTGVLVGGAPWYPATRPEDYGIYVANGVGELRLFNVHYGNGSRISNLRLPPGISNVVVTDTALGTNGEVQVRNAALRLREKPLRIDGSSSADRPSAAGVGAGSQWYDTTLGLPIWSDGTNWRNAVGEIV